MFVFMGSLTGLIIYRKSDSFSDRLLTSIIVSLVLGLVIAFLLNIHFIYPFKHFNLAQFTFSWLMSAAFIATISFIGMIAAICIRSILSSFVK